MLQLTLIPLLCVGLALAGNADSQEQSRDKVGYMEDGSYVLRVTSGGHIFGGDQATNELGSPDYPWYRINTATGLTNHHETLIDLAAKSSFAFFADGVGISTDTLAAGGTTFTTQDITQSAVPRNAVVLATVTTVVGQSTLTITSGNAYIEGINSVGVSTNEYVSLVSTGDASVGRGNVAWAHISSVTVKNIVFSRTPDATLYIYIGTSDKIGLANDIDNINDIYKVTDDRVAKTGYTANAQFNTITNETTPNASVDFDYWYTQKYFATVFE